MKKIIIKTLVFITIFVTIFIFASRILMRKGNGYGSDILAFYHEPQNSIDLIFFGSSHSYATFNPTIIETETGLNSFNFATQQQPLWISYYYMKEALKYQKPEYFVLEILMTSVDDEYASEGANRDAIDKMRFSLNKIKAINASVKDFYERFSYYFNIIKYHDRWNSLDKTDILNLLSEYRQPSKGYTYLPKGNTPIKRVDLSNYKERKNLSKKNSLYLNKIIDLTRDNNIKLILVKSPTENSEQKQAYYNEVKKIALEKNIDFLDYNMIYNEVGIDFNEDFFDTGHLDTSGAKKVSKHFSNYLKMVMNEKGEKND